MRWKSRGGILLPILFGASLALPLTSAAPVAAQPAKPARSQEDEARIRFNEGIAVAEAGNHEAARQKFGEAWALFKSPVILFNLARAEGLSQHYVEAFEHWRLFQKLWQDPKINDQQRQKATEMMKEVSAHVGQISVDAPPNTKVTIDGKALDNPTEIVVVTLGKHTVEATIDGKPRSVTVDAPANVVTSANLKEEAAPAPPPKQPEHLTPPPTEESSRFWTTGRFVGVGLMGVGAVGLGLGVFFHLGVTSADDDANQARSSLPADSRTTFCGSIPTDPRCVKLQQALDDRKTNEGLRAGSLIAGGVFLVSGAVLLLVAGPSKKSASAVHLVPIASAHEAGAALVGRF